MRARVVFAFLGVVLAVTQPAVARATPAGWGPGVEAAFSEVLQAARGGDVNLIRAAVWRYVRELRAAVETLRQALLAPGELPPGLAVAARTVEEATRRHLTVLQSLLGRVPEQARPALEHALEAAKRGHEQANVALDRAAEGAARDRKPENTGRPGGTPGGASGRCSGRPGWGQGAALAAVLYNNRRFDDVNRRFDDVNGRIDDVHRRIDDLRADMNARFAQVDARFAEVHARLAELREDLREIRGMLQEALRARAP